MTQEEYTAKLDEVAKEFGLNETDKALASLHVLVLIDYLQRHSSAKQGLCIARMLDFIITAGLQKESNETNLST